MMRRRRNISAYRDELMESLRDLSGAAAADTLLIEIATSAIGDVAKGPSFWSTLENGVAALERLNLGSASAGLSEATAQLTLGAAGLLLGQIQREVSLYAEADEYSSGELEYSSGGPSTAYFDLESGETISSAYAFAAERLYAVVTQLSAIIGAGVVTGESASVVSHEITMLVSKVLPCTRGATAAHHAPALASGAAASLEIPAGVLCPSQVREKFGQIALNDEHSVEIVLLLFSTNAHAFASLNHNSSIAATPIASMFLRNNGTAFRVQHSDTPLQIWMGLTSNDGEVTEGGWAWQCEPMAAPHQTVAGLNLSSSSPPHYHMPSPNRTCRRIYGSGSCEEFDHCSDRGTCMDGRCVCRPGFIGSNCSALVTCRYWDESSAAWRDDGLMTTHANESIGCLTSHLTEFGGIISFPTSAAELLSDLRSSVHFNAYSIDEAFTLLSQFNFDDNLTVMLIVIVLVLLDLATVVIFGYCRARRKRLVRHRDGRFRDDEVTAFEVQQLAQRVRQAELHARGKAIMIRTGCPALRQAPTRHASFACAPKRSKCSATEQMRSQMGRGFEPRAARAERWAKAFGRTPSRLLPAARSRKVLPALDAVDPHVAAAATKRSGSSFFTQRDVQTREAVAVAESAHLVPMYDAVDNTTSFNLSIGARPALSAESARKATISQDSLLKKNEAISHAPCSAASVSPPRAKVDLHLLAQVATRIPRTPGRPPPVLSPSARLRLQAQSRSRLLLPPRLPERVPPHITRSSTQPPLRPPPPLPPGRASTQHTLVTIAAEGSCAAEDKLAMAPALSPPPSPPGTTVDGTANPSTDVCTVASLDAHTQDDLPQEHRPRKQRLATLRRRALRLLARQVRPRGALLSFADRFVSTWREEHSLTALFIAPEQESEGDLTLVQTVQLFWHALAVEMVVICLTHSPSPAPQPVPAPRTNSAAQDAASGGGQGLLGIFEAVSIVPAMVGGLIAAGLTACFLTVHVIIFKWGNSRRHRPSMAHLIRLVVVDAARGGFTRIRNIGRSLLLSGACLGACVRCRFRSARVHASGAVEAISEAIGGETDVEEEVDGDQALDGTPFVALPASEEDLPLVVQEDDMSLPTSRPALLASLLGSDSTGHIMVQPLCAIKVASVCLPDAPKRLGTTIASTSLTTTSTTTVGAATGNGHARQAAAPAASEFPSDRSKVELGGGVRVRPPQLVPPSGNEITRQHSLLRLRGSLREERPLDYTTQARLKEALRRDKQTQSEQCQQADELLTVEEQLHTVEQALTRTFSGGLSNGGRSPMPSPNRQRKKAGADMLPPMLLASTSSVMQQISQQLSEREDGARSMDRRNETCRNDTDAEPCDGGIVGDGSSQAPVRLWRAPASSTHLSASVCIHPSDKRPMRPCASEDSTAVRIQAAHRVSLAGRDANHRRQMQTEENSRSAAAIRIQAQWRVRAARARVQLIRDGKAEEARRAKRVTALARRSIQRVSIHAQALRGRKIGALERQIHDEPVKLSPDDLLTLGELVKLVRVERWRGARERTVRTAIAWMLNFLIMALQLFWSVVLCLGFGDKDVAQVVASWILAFSATALIVEPLQVFMLAAAPALFTEDNACGRCMQRLRFMYNEYFSV